VVTFSLPIVYGIFGRARSTGPSAAVPPIASPSLAGPPLVPEPPSTAGSPTMAQPTPTAGPPSAAPAARGPWKAQGSGVTITVESVTRLGDTLTIPISVISKDDVTGFGMSVFDQAGNPMNPVHGWGSDPQAGITVRNVIVLKIDPSSPPTALTLTFKGFFWSQDQRLVLRIPSP
jgi:hypothetical protein